MAWHATYSYQRAGGTTWTPCTFQSYAEACTYVAALAASGNARYTLRIVWTLNDGAVVSTRDVHFK